MKRYLIIVAFLLCPFFASCADSPVKVEPYNGPISFPKMLRSFIKIEKSMHVEALKGNIQLVKYGENKANPLKEKDILAKGDSLYFKEEGALVISAQDGSQPIPIAAQKSETVVFE